MDLADGGRDLLDVDWLVLPGQPGLLMRNNEAEDGGNGDLARDLGKTKDKQVRPAVANKSNLGVVPASKKVDYNANLNLWSVFFFYQK